MREVMIVINHNPIHTCFKCGESWEPEAPQSKLAGEGTYNNDDQTSLLTSISETRIWTQ